MGTSTQTPSRTEVLAAPGDHTVKQVLDAFEDSTPAEVAAAQALERDDKDRDGIAAYTVPVADDEPRFARDRIFDAAEGPAIVGVIDGLGREATHPEIVGALYGDNADEFTRPHVQGKVEAFLTRPAHPQEA